MLDSGVKIIVSINNQKVDKCLSDRLQNSIKWV